MPLFRKSLMLSAFAVALLVVVQAAPPRRPRPWVVDDRVKVVFRSSPDGAEVRYTLSGGSVMRSIKKKLPWWLGGNTDAGARTNETKSFPFDNGLEIKAVFKLAGYQDCTKVAVVKVDQKGRRMEVDGDSHQLDSNSSANPAIIRCDLAGR